MIKICLLGDIFDFAQGISALLPEIPLEICSEGIPVSVKKGAALCAQLSPQGGVIECATSAQFFRALGLIAQYGTACNIAEKPCFSEIGAMLDVSRGAVLKPDAVCSLLRKMALMGYNTLMLYTEDTFEVPEIPAFGYLRGRYSQQQLRELDDYAFALGIEMFPCIQTLGHSERILQWRCMEQIRDTEDILLADDDCTEAYLHTIMRAASAPYRSRRIHIGMDEAFGIGLGASVKKKGYRPAQELLQAHLQRVREIAAAEGLSPMMWSDMHFRLASETGDYYDTNVQISPQTIRQAPQEIDLVYWDYYHIQERDYSTMLEKHAQFAAKTIFAGGIWSWLGPAVHYDVTLKTSIPALYACKKAGVDAVFATVWGDNGGECSVQAALYGLQLYADFSYSGEYCKEQLNDRFAFCCHCNPDAFTAMTALFTPPGTDAQDYQWLHYLMYEDPLLPLFGKDNADQPQQQHYHALAVQFAHFAAQNKEYALLFEFLEALSRFLANKCAWRAQAAQIVAAADRKQAEKLLLLAQTLCKDIAALKKTWQALWLSQNKPFGFEIIDMRLGAMRSRMETAYSRVQDFCAGRIDSIEELAEPKLYCKDIDGAHGYRGAFTRCVSASAL